MSNSFPERKILPVRSRRSLGRERRSVSNSDQGQLSTPPIFGNPLRITQPPEISPASDNLSPPVSLEHEILPMRLRRSLDQAGERQDPISTLGASANSQRVERTIEVAPASSDLSPPRSDSAVASNVTPSNAGFLSSSYEGNDFAFKGLDFGRQPTLQLDAMRPSPIPDSQTRSSDLSLPILSGLEPEDPQSLHILFSDEKIAVSTENEGLGMPIPVLLNGDSASAECGPSTPPRRRTSLFSQMSELGTSPSLYPHQRSVSVSSSISDVSYYNDPTSPYDVGSEEPPLEPFFASPFQTALQKGLDIAKDAADAMETAGQSLVAGGDLQRLINDAKELSTFKSSETRTIAVLGDSGEGKSSLINSLLHFPNIAKTGDIGAACTSVVTEYRQKTTDHLAPITIEVEYLSMGEIEDLIKELVWNYRQMYLPHTEGDSVSENEYATMQRESEQAWSSLEAGFSHQPSFNKAMLINDISEAGLSIANSQLVQWAYELNWPDSGENGKWTSTADTADECCEKTSVFMEDRFWPFTKIIRVYLQADVLKTGIILADLPGLHDTNLARVKATQDYLLRCNYIFIVAKISRAITDQSLKSSLYSILSRHAELEWEESAGKSMKVAVVCTKSEDINVKAARQEFCGPNKSIPQGVMTKLDEDIKEAKAQRNKALKKHLKRKQQLLLISARNTHVKEGLQRAYSSKVPNGGLEVFCVSNTTYGKYTIKGNVEMVQASGIPELRRFCYTMTAHAQLLEARHFLSSMLSSLLNSAELLATKPTESQQPTETGLDESMLLAVNNGKTETLRAVSQSKSEFQDTFRELVLMLLDKQSEVWETVAKQNSASWNNWHWTQYNAWCRHDGYHYTEKRGKVNWNAELIWKMRMEMAFQWETLEEDIPTLFKDLLQSAKAPLLALQSEMREKCFSPLLVEGIDFRIQSLTYRCSLAEQNFAKEVKITRSKASEPNESSYIFAEMVPAYRSAANEYGTGKAARQRNTVQGRITNGTLFPNISTAIKREIETAAKTTFDSVLKSLESDFALIENDVTMALASAPQQSGDREDVACEEEERRRGELAGAVRGLKRQHAEVLASIADI
ncbi:hypothetical protein VE01_05489 [Pseudogymnoascus verrucosus]|uniref:G domain-containing protein n=1 Tax=Pseudogymnoascus verrucosus TaxID=342668 RepID=A0A1B8GMB0_9PEZI|nr:uncharacterized protein VE01_05489 [Pseudogymnoascus verrucosus]OBT96981.1 hypothetical protein VE01_05489 [Pseudogymnoascus verrucosus]